MAPSRACLGDDEVSAFLAGGLDAAAIDAIELHLDDCAACRRRVGAHAARSRTATTDDRSLHALLRALVVTPTTAAAGVEPPPSVIDEQYRIVRRLGAGGMGVVYLARDLRLDRDVAVKLGTARSAQALQRVRREAVALGRLSHPNVVVVYQVGELDDRLYLTMEYVAGGNAREWRAARPRTWREIVALYGAAGDGLAAAHAAGLIHRDVKPDNILVGLDGRPRVADFGLARDVAPTGDGAIPVPLVTEPGAVVGTPPYMSPEQIAGEPLDARSDQFSFCASLWEALFGERPFRGRSAAERAAAIRAAPPEVPASARAHEVPDRVIAIVRRGLHPDPAARWPSMDALLAELRHAPPARRRRLGLAAALVAVAAVTALAVHAMTTADAPIATRERGDTPVVVTGGVDPQHIDVSAYYAVAAANARKVWPDAALSHFSADGVRPDGTADVTLRFNYAVTYAFVSREHSQHAQGSDEPECAWWDTIRKAGRHTSLHGCEGDAAIRPPRCTVAQVWQKAIAQGAPAAGAVATITYRGDDDGVYWLFDSGTKLSLMIPDDC